MRAKPGHISLLKGGECVVDAPDDDVGCVEAGQRHQQLMETITKFWF